MVFRRYSLYSPAARVQRVNNEGLFAASAARFDNMNSLKELLGGKSGKRGLRSILMTASSAESTPPPSGLAHASVQDEGCPFQSYQSKLVRSSFALRGD